MKKETFVRICKGFSEIHRGGTITIPGLNFSNDFRKNEALIKKLINAIKSEGRPDWKPREDKRVSLMESDDVYTILSDPYIWQRQRFIAAIRIILRGVIESKQKMATWYIDDEKEINFLEIGIDFPRIEKIAYDLIDVGEVEHAIYILEDMREKIQDPLIQGLAYVWFWKYKEAEEVFSENQEVIEKQMTEWFS